MKCNMRFIETIRITDGVMDNLFYHQERMLCTSTTVFGQPIDFELSKISISVEYRQGIVKCRVLYDNRIQEISFQHYQFRTINSLRLVDGKDIVYSLKSEDRTGLNQLYSGRGGCDEILIVKDGLLTDTSFSNVVLQDSNGLFYTPDTFLLNGTRRQQLLHDGHIQETPIPIDDLKLYEWIYIINAMIRLEDKIRIPVTQVSY